jgi:hypothetical protein
MGSISVPLMTGDQPSSISITPLNSHKKYFEHGGWED